MGQPHQMGPEGRLQQPKIQPDGAQGYGVQMVAKLLKIGFIGKGGDSEKQKIQHHPGIAHRKPNQDFSLPAHMTTSFTHGRL